MDYTVIPEKIIESAEEYDPLTDSQKLAIIGGLSGIQQLIEAFGLEETVERLSRSETK